MKVKTEEQLLEAIEAARKYGTVTFTSSNPEGDRQKVYRMLRAIKANTMPLFPNEYDFTVGTGKGGTVTIKRDTEEAMLFVPTPEKEVQQAIEKKKRRKKVPTWIEKELNDCSQLEQAVAASPERDKYPDKVKLYAEFFDTRRIAADHYMDFYETGVEDEPLYNVIKYRSPFDPKFDRLVVTAFTPHHVPPDVFPDGPLTTRQKLADNARRRGEIPVESRSPEDRAELKRLLEEHERLLKLLDEEDKDKPPL